MPPRSRARRAAAFVALLLALAAGCAAKGPARGTVTGKVSLAGSPVAGGATVLFEGEAQGVAAQTEVGPDGTFRFATYQGEGLPVGSYKVAVLPGGTMASDAEAPLAGKPAPPRPKAAVAPIPPRYHSTATSRLTAEVKAGANDPFEFHLVP